MKDRALRVFSRIDPAPDLLVLANGVEPRIDPAFFYLFDAPSGLFEGSLLIARPDGSAHVLSSPLEEQSARVAAKEDPSITVDLPSGDVRYGQRHEWLKAYLSRFVSNGANVALNYGDLTHSIFLDIQRALPSAKFQDASEAIRQTRMIKDALEVERIERAGAIASRVAEQIPGMLHEGMTELDLAAEVEYAMAKGGGGGRSFDTIAAFGPATAEPHYKPQERRLARGDPIVCDFGAFHRRYASDITRSFQFGKPDEEMHRIYDTVRAAQSAALDAVRAGVPAKEVHLAAQRVIDGSPWKGRFIHGVGHSVGLAVHDGFSMGPSTEEKLAEGMALTVEPGIYLPGRGGVRIEDDIVVTRDGFRFLTTAPREYVEVGV
jgi:Xaa-Pro aminopeptidase